MSTIYAAKYKIRWLYLPCVTSGNQPYVAAKQNRRDSSIKDVHKVSGYLPYLTAFLDCAVLKGKQSQKNVSPGFEGCRDLHTGEDVIGASLRKVILPAHLSVAALCWGVAAALVVVLVVVRARLECVQIKMCVNSGLDLTPPAQSKVLEL